MLKFGTSLKNLSLKDFLIHGKFFKKALENFSLFFSKDIKINKKQFSVLTIDILMHTFHSLLDLEIVLDRGKIHSFPLKIGFF